VADLVQMSARYLMKTEARFTSVKRIVNYIDVSFITDYKHSITVTLA